MNKGVATYGGSYSLTALKKNPDAYNASVRIFLLIEIFTSLNFNRC